MNIPGLDLCPTGDDEFEIGIELFTFKGTFSQIPKSQMNGVCRPVTDFAKIGPLKVTSTWIMRECFDPKKQETVCIMKYKDSKESEENMENDLATLRREIEILSAMKHDNILTFIEPVVGETLESVYLVFDFARYYLSDIISKNVTGLYQKPMIKNIMKQLLQAVDYLHNNLIMHRYIAPINILFNKDGVLKLANFHHARKLNSGNLNITVPNKSYQAPEILLKAKQHGSAVDMWGVGCVFAELLLKRNVFIGDSNETIFRSIISVLGVPSDSIWKDYSNLPGLQELQIEDFHSCNYLRKILKKSNLCTIESIQMVKDMLIYDPAFRVTASDCLEHSYFAENPSAYSEDKVAELLKLSGIIIRQNAVSIRQ